LMLPITSEATSKPPSLRSSESSGSSCSPTTSSRG
jgi:hypothetical protein